MSIRKIIAEEGLFWTNGTAVSSDNIVYLGVRDREENWRQITPAEKEEIEHELSYISL